MAGHPVGAPGVPIWDIPSPDAAFTAAAQGFGWLDDLAAVGDAAARTRAQDWTWAWIRASKGGRGPGWAPDLTGRRVMRWISHADFLLNGKGDAEAGAFFASLSAQTAFLSQRVHAAAPGLPRFEGLTGLVCASVALEGLEEDAGPAADLLARECEAGIDAQGAIPSRSPEELLEIFTLLTWAAQALAETGQQVPPGHLAALTRIAPALRALRHSEGGLARFHGGDRGLEGRLDTALAAAGVRLLRQDALAMGFARLSGGRSTVIADAAAPPRGEAAGSAHASTLAFELTSGRRPFIVSAGPGTAFGADWHRVGRATASHSTLTLDGVSSSRFGSGDQGRDVLTDRAQVTVARPLTFAQSHGIVMAHDGWSRTHGLIHNRELMLSNDGRQLSGLDELSPVTPAERRRFDAVLARKDGRGIAYAVRFHLHPDVGAEIDLGGAVVSIMLKSGEVWVFQPEQGPVLSIEPSVYMETGHLTPRATRQIVLSGTIKSSETRIVWTLAKAQDTPLAIRDTESA